MILLFEKQQAQVIRSLDEIAWVTTEIQKAIEKWYGKETTNDWAIPVE